MLKPFSLSLLLAGILFAEARAADQPQWGQAWSRNMVSSEKGLPDSFDPATGANVKWSVKLGTQTYSTPVVAGGRVYIGTNNEQPRDPNHTDDCGVLMCFDEKTGEFLWQLAVPKREEDPYHDWPKTGMPSPVTVEGDRVYMLNNRGEVMCLDARGMANGNDGPFKDEAAHMLPRATNAPANPPPAGPRDADVLWLFNLTTGAGIWSHDGANSSMLIRGDYLYLNSATGVDNTHRRIRTPDAPSLVVLDKRTGRYIARDDEHIASNIFHCTWSSPSLGEVRGKPAVFLAAGNGFLYGFEPVSRAMARAAEKNNAPQTLRKLWEYDFDPERPPGDIHRYLTNRREGPSDFYGMPVYLRGRLYVAGGGDLWWGKNQAWLKCIDPNRGDASRTNGLVWSTPLQKHVLSTPAIYDGMIFIADCGREMHCIDAASGQIIWTQEIKGEVWASPMVADGKVYLGTREGEYWIFAASREKKVLGMVNLHDPISATTIAANGTLYIATARTMYAVARASSNPSGLP